MNLWTYQYKEKLFGIPSVITLSFVLCNFRVYFVDEGTASVMNSKSAGLQMCVTRHKTQGCVSSCVYISPDKGFMAQERWNRETDTRESIYGAVNNQTGLAGTSNEIYLGQRRSDATWCGKKPYELEVQSHEYLSCHFEFLKIW
jgi:hypothetical protein